MSLVGFVLFIDVAVWVGGSARCWWALGVEKPSLGLILGECERFGEASFDVILPSLAQHPRDTAKEEEYIVYSLMRESYVLSM